MAKYVMTTVMGVVCYCVPVDDYESLQSQLNAADVALSYEKQEAEADALKIAELRKQLAAANERADRYKEFWEATLLDCREAGERADVKAAAHSDMAEMYRKEKERADGLQRIVDEARAQKPFAYAYRKRGSLRPYWIYADELPTHDDVIDWRELYAAPVPAQPAVVPEGLADTVLANIAAIAHCGGLAKLDNENALSNIRQLSKPWCDNTGTLRDLKNRVDAAILSATDTEGRKP